MKNNDKIYYFAFGSNLSLEQMRNRCPDAVFIECHEIHGWQFHYTKRGFASIRKNESASVWGAVFSLSHRDKLSLDRYEGVHKRNGYQEQILECYRDNKIITYIEANYSEGEGFKNYHEHIVNAARVLKLPSDYIENNILTLPVSANDSKRKYCLQNIRV